jgi:hypothetical protein
VPQVRLPSDYPNWETWRQTYGEESANKIFGLDQEVAAEELAAIGVPLDQMAEDWLDHWGPWGRTEADGLRIHEPEVLARQRATHQVANIIIRAAKQQPPVSRQLQF